MSVTTRQAMKLMEGGLIRRCTNHAETYHANHFLTTHELEKIIEAQLDLRDCGFCFEQPVTHTMKANGEFEAEGMAFVAENMAIDLCETCYLLVATDSLDELKARKIDAVMAMNKKRHPDTITESMEREMRVKLWSMASAEMDALLTNCTTPIPV